MDAPFIRDEEDEDKIQRLIYENARGREPDEDDDDYGSQFLNDFGDELEDEERRDDELSLTKSGKVYLYILRLYSSVDALIYLYCTY